jgi:hypothetical protein
MEPAERRAAIEGVGREIESFSKRLAAAWESGDDVLARRLQKGLEAAEDQLQVLQEGVEEEVVVEEEKEVVVEDEDDDDYDCPEDSDTRVAWDEYATAKGFDVSLYSRKEDLIMAVRSAAAS